MPCRDYEHRPRICRELDCGRPCEHCGGCEGNVVLQVSGAIDPSDADFYERHGMKVVLGADYWELHMFAPCRDYEPLPAKGR